MDVDALIIRSFAAWLLLSVMLRLSGKESVSELNGRALIVTLIISDLIDDFVLGTVPAANFTVAVGAVLLTRSLIGLAAVYSDRVYALVEGDASMLMSSGKLHPRAMRQQRVNEKELAAMLRIRGVDEAQWRELQAVRLERSGAASGIRHRWARALQRADVGSKGKARNG